MSTTTRSRRKYAEAVEVSCGCRPRRSKLSSLFSFSGTDKIPPLPKLSPNTNPLFMVSPTATTISSYSNSTSSSSSFYYNQGSSPSEIIKKDSTKKNKNVDEGHDHEEIMSSVIAEVKESTDPYRDFKDSMLVMIVEKQLYACEDLRHLLLSFLDLNSRIHHKFILRAFSDLWSQLFELPSPMMTSFSGGRRKPLHHMDRIF